MPLEPSSEDRLDSWKEIAAYLKRDVTTVQRWERREGMPVHRHVHDKGGSVYAFRTELDTWSGSRKVTPVTDGQRMRSTPEEPPEHTDVVVEDVGRGLEATPGRTGEPPVQTPVPPWRLSLWLLVATAGMLVLGLTLWQLGRESGSGPNPLTGARFQQLTDFGGTEQAAALSRDGKFVTFLSDRDGRMDVWVSQIGMGQFYNLTRGAALELVNPSVRTLGFSPDGTVVTFWARKSGGLSQTDISIWATPCLADPHDRTWRVPPNSTGRATALISSITRQDQAIRCSCGIATGRLGRSFRLRQDFTRWNKCRSIPISC